VLNWKFPQPAGGGIVKITYPFVVKAANEYIPEEPWLFLSEVSFAGEGFSLRLAAAGHEPRAILQNRMGANAGGDARVLMKGQVDKMAGKPTRLAGSRPNYQGIVGHRRFCGFPSLISPSASAPRGRSRATSMMRWRTCATSITTSSSPAPATKGGSR
jgi:hypothetical protein